MRSLFITLLVIHTAANSYADELPSFEDFMIDYNNKYFCSNNEYISCMKITRTTCIESFTKAIQLCVAQKDTNSPMPSPVCITNNYIKFAKVNDKVVKSCEHIVAGITAKVIPENMPNNVLNSDAAQKTRSAH